MEKSDDQYKAHVFVCTNQKKPGKSCCAPLGAEDMRRELKEWTHQHPEWAGKIRINASGCLDHCENGIAVAIYPQNVWFSGVKPSDLSTLKAEIEKLMDSK